jgi:hypothetical protein
MRRSTHRRWSEKTTRANVVVYGLPTGLPTGGGWCALSERTAAAPGRMGAHARLARAVREQATRLLDDGW